MSKGATSADNTAKKEPRRRGKALGDNTPKEHRETQQAYLVSGEGSDADIRERCLADVPGFAEMSPKVQAELVRLMRVFWEMAPTPLYELRDQPGGGRAIGGPDGSNITLTALRTVEAFASGSADFTNRRLGELGETARARGELSSANLMSDLAFVVGGGAKDTVQSTLLTQMAATHNAALKALNLSMRSEWVDQSVQMGNLANRLLNTFTRQAEALAKLQRDGTQTVKHVHIDNRHGGQTVVTDTVQTGGANFESQERAHTTSAGATMRSADANGGTLSLEAGAGSQALPDAWLCSGLGSEAGE